MHGAITSFRITNRTSEQDNAAIAKYLLEQHNIFTIERDGPANGSCVRVTPALFTPREHVDRLATAVRDVAERFRA